MIIFIPSTGLCFFTLALRNLINLIINRCPRRSLFMLGDVPSWWAACYIQTFRFHYVTNICSYITAFIHLFIHSFLFLSVLRQFYNLFLSHFPTECDLVLHPSIYSILFFPYGRPIFPSISCFRRQSLFRCDQSR
jgi:hypothetical protein